MKDALRLAARILWRNLGTFGMAFGLALAVWISAVVADDPNVERDFPRPLALEVRGLASGLVVVGEVPAQVTVRLRAPQSLWERLAIETGLVRAYVDLSAAELGEQLAPVELDIGLTPVQVLQVLPAEIPITVERRLSAEWAVGVEVTGEPALGYLREFLTSETSVVTLSGPETLMNEVARVVALLDISGARADITEIVPLRALNADGQVITGLTISPAQATIVQTIRQAGGYRDVAVKVETVGQLANGYRVTNISVSPPTITVFSSDPQRVAEMPGFVSTSSLDLTGADDDIETRLSLLLPEGVTLVSQEQSVIVQVGVAAIETSIRIAVDVSVIGLPSEYSAEFSPASVDLILSGPVPVLDALTTEDVRVFVDLTDLGPGTHLVELKGEILPVGVTIDSLTPGNIEVIIRSGANPATPTRTPTPIALPSSTPTPRP